MSCAYCTTGIPGRMAAMRQANPRAKVAPMAVALGIGRNIAMRIDDALRRSGCYDGTCNAEAPIHCDYCAYGGNAGLVKALIGKTRGDCVPLARQLRVRPAALIKIYLSARERGCLGRYADTGLPAKSYRYVPPPVAAWRLPPIGSAQVAA